MKLKMRVKIFTILFTIGFAGFSGGCVSDFIKGIEQEMGLRTGEATEGTGGDEVVADPDMLGLSVRKTTATGAGAAILTGLGALFWKKFGFASIPGFSKK